MGHLLKVDFAQALSVQRNIIGICPICQTFFRLNECRFIYKRGRKDWLARMYDLEKRLEETEVRLEEREREIREQAREQGRVHARRIIKKADPIFASLGLSVNDAKAIFHPISFVVFDGLDDYDDVDKLYLLDRKRSRGRTLQKSIERCVSKKHYDWRTFRVSDDGKVIEE